MSNNSSPAPTGQRIAFLLLGASLAFGFIVAADKLSKALAQVRSARAEVTVKGVATQDIQADEGELTGTLLWRGTDLAAGRLALETQREVLRRLLKDAGLAETESAFSTLTVTRLEPARANATNVNYAQSARGNVPDFIVTSRFTIQSSKTQVITKLTRQEINLGQEVELQRGETFFRVLRFDESKKELLEFAAKDARRRAEVLVAGSGSKVGALVDAAQGVFQISAKGRVNDSDYGSIDNTAMEKTIRVVVTMRFEIVKE